MNTSSYKNERDTYNNGVCIRHEKPQEIKDFEVEFAKFLKNPIAYCKQHKQKSA